MRRVSISATGRTDTTIQVEDGDTVLVGRDLDLERSTRAPESDPVETVTIATPSVSSVHLQVSARNGLVELRDMGSKNGTWLKLPGNETLQVGYAGDLSLRLGSDATAGGPGSQPQNARWNDATDYHLGIKSAIEEWLRAVRISAKVRVVDTVNHDESRPDCIPLANKKVLNIEPLETVDTDWPIVLAQAWKYCASQGSLFDAEETTRSEGLILASDAMRQAHREVMEAASHGLRTLLIIGPSGAGKDGLARCYHRNSGRNGPFVARNCSMFNREFLRSELFGAEVGAFSGCVRRIIGAVERAQNGTLFLDEIGEMGAEIQPMLLRFLDRGEYERMGGDSTSRNADTRIVAATNRDLKAAVRGGEFRADLWYRLAVQVVEVPPLRDRYADIVAYLSSRKLTDGSPLFSAFTAGALELIAQHPWDGNFRELMNFAEFVSRVRTAGFIDTDTCDVALKRVSLAPPPPRARAGVASGSSLDLNFSEMARLAGEAFGEDAGKPAPETWDEVKEYVEKYWKPCMFAHLSGAARDGSGVTLDIPALAKRLEADRGTAVKHVTRYFERFAR